MPKTLKLIDEFDVVSFRVIVQHIFIIQVTASGCCDFLAQCILVRILSHLVVPIIRFIHLNLQKIYRCWIVWGKNTSVVIVPSFFAITFLGQSIDSHMISRLEFIAGPLATWLAQAGSTSFVQGQLVENSWGGSMDITSFTLSIVVNTLVTGLIVFKIFKVSLEINAVTTSNERTLGTTGGTKIRHVVFIIIESGMALLAVQLVRVTLYILPLQLESAASFVYIIFIGINQMCNVIIRSVLFYRFTDNIYYLDRASHQQ